MTNNIVETIPVMLPIKEVANRTGLSYDHIRKLCLSGKVVYIKAGSKYLVNWSRFIDYLNAGDGSGGGVND